MWIDRIIELEKGQRCVTVKNVSLAEEHLHDHFDREATENGRALPIMPAPLMIEGMAQTAGILVGHAKDFSEKVILAKIGKAKFECDVFPGQTIFYEATLDRIDGAGASTTGRMSVVDYLSGSPRRREMGEIQLMFSHVDQNMSGLDFPERNFVFTEQFMDLLKNSGF